MLHDVGANLALFVLDALVVAWVVWGRRSPLVPLCVGGVLALLVPVFVLGGSGDIFATFRAAAWLVFLHGPLMLGFTAWAERSPLRWVAAALAVIGVVVGVDAFWVEPNLLFVNHHRVVSAKVTEPLRIAVLADIQTDAPGWRMRRAVRAAMDAAPDLLLLPGDYVQTNGRSEHDAAVTAFRAILSEEGLGAPLGAVAVRGNVEHDGWAPSVFGGLPVHAAEATARHSLGGGAVTVTALSFRDGFSTGLRVPAGAGLHVVVGHAPDFALGDIDADILVAGHTHGGQVRLPGIGPLVTFSRVPRAWAAGRTELPSGATLFVSRGVGMERATAPRLRFLCPPEVMIIDVTPGSP